MLLGADNVADPAGRWHGGEGTREERVKVSAAGWLRCPRAGLTGGQQSWNMEVPVQVATTTFLTQPLALCAWRRAVERPPIPHKL